MEYYFGTKSVLSRPLEHHVFGGIFLAPTLQVDILEGNAPGVPIGQLDMSAHEPQYSLDYFPESLVKYSLSDGRTRFEYVSCLMQCFYFSTIIDKDPSMGTEGQVCH
jgi:hypothetical protein